MVTSLDTLRDVLCQAQCDHDQTAAHQPLINIHAHPFALADYRARIDVLMGPINEWALRLLAGTDADYSWAADTHPCHQHNDGGAGPLVCTRTDTHTTHTFAATSGVHTKASEASD